MLHVVLYLHRRGFEMQPGRAGNGNAIKVGCQRKTLGLAMHSTCGQAPTILKEVN